MAGESKLQRKCVDICKEKRIIARKINADSNRGWPDLLLIFPISGETVYVEMKNPNGKGILSSSQRLEHKKIRAQGASVYTCDTLDKFNSIIKEHLK